MNKKMNNVEKRNMVVVDITTKINEKIKEVFVGYSNQYIEKVQFLVWLINRAENGYQLHQENHKNFFGLSGNAKYSIQTMIQKLIENKMIVRTSLYEVGATSIEYKIIANYKWVKTEGDVKKYYNDVRELPTFIKKFMVDFYVVKGVKFTDFQKDVQIEIVEGKKVNEVEESSLINELREKLNQQNLLIQSLQKTIEELKNNKPQSAEEKVEEIKKEINIYQQFAIDRMKAGVNDFETLYAELYTKFITDGMPEEIEKELNEILYDAVESVLEM